MEPFTTFCSFCKKHTQVRSDISEGNATCLSCGLLLEVKLIDCTQEYNLYAESSSGTDRRRVGSILDELFHDSSLNLMVVGQTTSKHNKIVDYFEEKSFQRSLKHMYHQVKQWASLMNLKENAIKKVKFLIKDLSKSRQTFKGASIEEIASGILLQATRLQKLGVTPEDIERYTGVSKKNQYKALKFLEEKPKTSLPDMDISDKLQDSDKTTGSTESICGPLTYHSTLVDPEDYCKRFQRELNLTKELKSLSGQICQAIKTERLLDGKNPKTMAGVAIFSAFILSGTQIDKQIFQVIPVGEKTLKLRYSEIESELKKSLNKMDEPILRKKICL